MKLSPLIDRARLPRDISKNIGYAWIYLESLLRPRHRHTSKKRILIMRMDHLGDCILFYPTLRAYREYYADGEITLILPRYFESLSPILKGLADKIIWFDNAAFNGSFSYRRRLMLDIARAGYDAFIYPVFARETIGYFMMKMIGAPESIGFDGLMTEHGALLERMGGLPYTRLIRVPAGMKREIDRGAYLAEAITGIKISISFPTIDVRRLPETKARELMQAHGLAKGQYAVIFPGAGAPWRMWPADRFAAIADRLASRNITPVIAGSPQEKKLADKIRSLSKSPEKILDLTGQTDLAALARILAEARFYFGSDTGILHLAAAVGCPAIGVVGSGGLERFFPYGDPAKNRAVYDRAGVESGRYKLGDWSDAESLRPGELHPSVSDITIADAQKEVDSMLQYLAS